MKNHERGRKCEAILCGPELKNVEYEHTKYDIDTCVQAAPFFVLTYFKRHFNYSFFVNLSTKAVLRAGRMTFSQNLFRNSHAPSGTSGRYFLVNIFTLISH